MTRYAAGQLVFAFVVAAVGAIKAYRLIVDEIDDATTRFAGLT